MQTKIDGLSITAVALILLLAVRLLNDASPASGAGLAAPPPTLSVATPAPDPQAFAAPYTSYIITQGLHGDSYGHLAIDLGAGEGAPILSPIHGEVTGLYLDEWGNPTLTIENEIFLVTLLHGDVTVSVGQIVALGEPVGYESNLGYTTDMAGNPCWEQVGCGYHTHLNVYDKRLGENINPFELLEK